MVPTLNSWQIECFCLCQANVMLEYPIDEAQELLERNLVTATENLEDIQADLEFLRDQRVTTEVSILHNSNDHVGS